MTPFSYQHLITLDKTRHERYLVRVTILWFLLLEILRKTLHNRVSGSNNKSANNGSWAFSIIIVRYRVSGNNNKSTNNGSWAFSIIIVRSQRVW